MYSIQKILAVGLLGSTLAFNANAQDEQTATNSNADSANIEVKKDVSPTDSQVGEPLYVSERANVWLRSCASANCKIVDVAHVGDEVKFMQASEDGKFILIDNGKKQLWMQTKDLQVQPCGKALVENLEGKVANLKNELENYDSELATELKKAKAKIEKLEKENATLVAAQSNQREKIATLDATRRDYADKLETKELDMQMRWWMQGAVIAFCGALIGIICVYIPRPNRKKKQIRF